MALEKIELKSTYPLPPKIEEDQKDIIDLDTAGSSPGDIVLEWHSETRKYFACYLNTTGEAKLINLMNCYIESLREQASHFEDTETLKLMMDKHLKHIYWMYTELDICYPDSYLDQMEHILTFYVNLSFRSLLKLKNKRNITRDMVIEMAGAVVKRLSLYLLSSEYHIFHVMIRQSSSLADDMVRDVIQIHNSYICKQLFRHIYMFYLVNQPTTDKSDEAFCRCFILFENWKVFDEYKTNENIEALMQRKFGKGSECIKENTFLKKILAPEPSIMTQLIKVVGCDAGITKAYFDYIKSKQKESAVILDDIGKLTQDLGSSSDLDWVRNTIYVLSEENSPATSSVVEIMCDNDDETSENCSMAPMEKSKGCEFLDTGQSVSLQDTGQSDTCSPDLNVSNDEMVLDRTSAQNPIITTNQNVEECNKSQLSKDVQRIISPPGYLTPPGSDKEGDKNAEEFSSSIYTNITSEPFTNGSDLCCVDQGETSAIVETTELNDTDENKNNKKMSLAQKYEHIVADSVNGQDSTKDELEDCGKILNAHTDNAQPQQVDIYDDMEQFLRNYKDDDTISLQLSKKRISLSNGKFSCDNDSSNNPTSVKTKTTHPVRINPDVIAIEDPTPPDADPLIATNREKADQRGTKFYAPNKKTPKLNKNFKNYFEPSNAEHGLGINLESKFEAGTINESFEIVCDKFADIAPANPHELEAMDPDNINTDIITSDDPCHSIDQQSDTNTLGNKFPLLENEILKANDMKNPNSASFSQTQKIYSLLNNEESLLNLNAVEQLPIEFCQESESRSIQSKISTTDNVPVDANKFLEVRLSESSQFSFSSFVESPAFSFQSNILPGTFVADSLKTTSTATEPKKREPKKRPSQELSVNSDLSNWRDSLLVPPVTYSNDLLQSNRHPVDVDVYQNAQLDFQLYQNARPYHRDNRLGQPLIQTSAASTASFPNVPKQSLMVNLPIPSESLRALSQRKSNFRRNSTNAVPPSTQMNLMVANAISSNRMNMAPTTQTNIVPSQMNMVPTSQMNLVPTSQMNLAQTTHMNLVPTSRLNVASTTHMNLVPTSGMHVVPTSRMHLVPTICMNLVPTTQVDRQRKRAKTSLCKTQLMPLPITFNFETDPLKKEVYNSSKIECNNNGYPQPIYAAPPDFNAKKNIAEAKISDKPGKTGPQPMPIPITFNFETDTLKKEVYNSSKIECQSNENDAEFETHLPLKKRKFSMPVPVAESKGESTKEISYPATPMLSIAEVYSIPMVQRQFKTPAEKKQLPQTSPPVLPHYDPPPNPVPYILNSFPSKNFYPPYVPRPSVLFPSEPFSN